MLDLADDELQLTITSLSITYDAYSRKLERVTGHRYNETVNDIDVCNRALAKAKAEQMRRLRRGDPILPIGAPPTESS